MAVTLCRQMCLIKRQPSGSKHSALIPEISSAREVGTDPRHSCARGTSSSNRTQAHLVMTFTGYLGVFKSKKPLSPPDLLHSSCTFKFYSEIPHGTNRFCFPLSLTEKGAWPPSLAAAVVTFFQMSINKSC